MARVTLAQHPSVNDGNRSIPSTAAAVDNVGARPATCLSADQPNQNNAERRRPPTAAAWMRSALTDCDFRNERTRQLRRGRPHQALDHEHQPNPTRRSLIAGLSCAGAAVAGFAPPLGS